MNAAGKEGFDDSQPIKIEEQSQNLSPQQVAGIVLGAVIGTGILVAALAIYLTRIWCASCCTHLLSPISLRLANYLVWSVHS